MHLLKQRAFSAYREPEAKAYLLFLVVKMEEGSNEAHKAGGPREATKAWNWSLP